MNNTDWQEYDNPALFAARNLLSAANAHLPLTLEFSEFVEVTSQLPIARLAYRERVFRNEISLAAQPHTRSRFILRPLLVYPHRLLIPWLDCCSGDGHRREDALRALSEGAPNSFLLAMVLRRLNDWVPEIRAAARDRIPVIVERTESKYVLEALWGILPYLHTWVQIEGRWNGGRYRPIINKREIALNRPFIEILIAAAKDRSPLVRRVAGDALFKDSDSLREGTVPIAKMLAKDPSPAVAERGVFALKRLEG